MISEPSAASQSLAPARPALRWDAILSSRLLLPVVLLLALAVYAPTLNDYFSGDDIWFLHSSDTISVADYIQTSFDYRDTGSLPELNRYRPLYPVAWRLQYEVFGLHAFGYHAVLLALHLASVAVVWAIALRITKRIWAAGLAALIFALHPGYADAVTWLSGGNRVFAAFPLFLSVLFFMKYCDEGRGRLRNYLASSVAFLAAVLLHPAAVGLAVVLPAYAFLVARLPSDALRFKAWLPLAPFIIVAIAMSAIHAWVRSHLEVQDQFTFGWHQYSIYGRYLSAALFPVFVLARADLADPLPRVLSALEGLASVAMIAMSVMLITRRKWPYVGAFIIVWLYVALFPDSTLVFPTQGRLLYMPGAPIALLLVAAVLMAIDWLPGRALPICRAALPFVLGLLLVATISLTAYNIRDWSDRADENAAFISRLQDDVPGLEQGAALYVVNPPANLFRFDTRFLEFLVELHYGDVDVRRVSLAEAAELEGTLGPNDRVFIYQP